MPSSQQREEALFDRALELPAADRAAWLERECVGDPALLARLKALLAAYEQPDARLAQPETARQGAGGLAVEMDVALGQVIGRYKLTEKLGEGGCGVVYVAEQAEPVRRQVALKVIKLGMDTRAVVARFEAERQTLAMMDHPNIAKVFDAGATDTGRPYFVMELVHGTRITDYCDEHQLATAARLDLFIKVCQAIQHAHQKGIIHRDIKPSNILVTLQDGVPVPKVIDFGIAKATEGRLTEATVHTQLHQFIGTPAYMSPEQAEMTGLDVDTRSDIYSLGVLLYELLAGSTPFDAKKLLASGLDQMRKTIREEEPPRPSTKLATLPGEELTSTGRRRALDGPRLMHSLQGDLDCIVMKCLEKERARRYETANGLAADVKRHLANEPVVARPPSAGYKFQKAIRRNQLAFTAAAVVFVALVAGIWASLSQAARATKAEKLAGHRLEESEKARTRALAAEADARQKAEGERAARTEAEAVAAMISRMFRSPNPTRDGRAVTVAETLDQAARKLEQDETLQPSRRIALQAEMAETYDSLGLYAESAVLREKIRDYHQLHSGREHPDTLGAMHQLASAWFLSGRTEEVVGLQEEVLRLRRKVLGPEHNDTLQTMLSLALSHHSAGRLEDALKLREEVLAVRRRTRGPDDGETLWALKAVAQSYHRLGRVDEALKMREQLLSTRRASFAPDHPQTLAALWDLSLSYQAAGRLDETLKLREELFPLLRKVKGPDHPETVRTAQALLEPYAALGRIKDTLPIQADTAARGPVNLLGSLQLAALQVWFGQESDYRENCQRALNSRVDVNIPGQAELMAKLMSLRAYSDPKMGEQALVLARFGMQHRQGNSLAAWFPLTLGIVEYRSGRYPEADATLLEAYEGGRNNPRISATAAFYRAMSLHQQGREAEALRLFAEAEKKMTPLPANEQNPLADAKANHDDLILWLACKEARTLLKAPSQAKQASTIVTRPE